MTLELDLQLSKKWQSFRPHIEGIASGLCTVAKNASSSASQGGAASTDSVVSLKQLLTAVAEPAREALAALSHLQPRSHMYSQFGAPASNSYSAPSGMHDPAFSVRGEHAMDAASTGTRILPLDAAGRILKQVEDLLSQLTATQQAAEAVTASLQDTVSHVRQHTTTSGMLAQHSPLSASERDQHESAELGPFGTHRSSMTHGIVSLLPATVAAQARYE